MKTTVTRILAVLTLVVFTAVALCACGSSPVGTWKFSSIEGNADGIVGRELAEAAEATVTIAKDTMTISCTMKDGSSGTLSCRCIVDNKRLVIGGEGEAVIDANGNAAAEGAEYCGFSISGSVLTITENGAKINLTKK